MNAGKGEGTKVPNTVDDHTPSWINNDAENKFEILGPRFFDGNANSTKVSKSARRPKTKVGVGPSFFKQRFLKVVGVHFLK